MTLFVSNVLLALVWTFLWEDVSAGQFFVGFVLAYGTLYTFRGLLPNSSYFRRSWACLKFFAVFAVKNIKANLIVAWEVLTPTNHMRPGFIRVEPRSDTPLEITWLAETISLLPGTLTVDTSEDDRYLYIHAMHVYDPEEIRRETLEEIEPLILEILR